MAVAAPIECASPSWPPGTWEIRRIVAEEVRVFHVNEEGFFMEPVPRGKVVLVEPPGPSGYRRGTGLTTAFTEMAAQLPARFENCCVRVADVLDGTELIGAYVGPLAFGSNGATAFPIA